MARIQVSHLTFAYEGSPDVIFDDVSFQIDTDWKLGFIGRNGRGKTTLLRILSGERPHNGAVSMPVACDYFPFSVSHPEKTPLELAEEYDDEGQIWRFLKEISLLDIQDEILSQPFSTLSGGEQAKVRLCKLINRESNILLLDEPTNHLDVDAKDELKRALQEYKGSILLICHEPEFYQDVATAVWDCTKWTTKIF